MHLNVLKSKIHRAKVTQTELAYMGSVSIDPWLMEAAGMNEYEKILVVNLESGVRFETYCIKGEPGQGTVCVNGAAARLAIKGDKIIIMSFCLVTPQELEYHRPKIVFVDENNAVTTIEELERHGQRKE
ncbi:MAG: aspartate 1-decarboxylase [Deltaproteobacteria bacterium]|nr:aspartate 1-decarboxylase [Deltaproteobacteria bacterium]